MSLLAMDLFGGGDLDFSFWFLYPDAIETIPRFPIDLAVIDCLIDV